LALSDDNRNIGVRHCKLGHMGAAIIFHKVVQERLDSLTRFIKTMSEVAHTSKNVDGVLAIIFVLHELYTLCLKKTRH